MVNPTGSIYSGGNSSQNSVRSGGMGAGGANLKNTAEKITAARSQVSASSGDGAIRASPTTTVTTASSPTPGFHQPTASGLDPGVTAPTGWDRVKAIFLPWSSGPVEVLGQNVPVVSKAIPYAVGGLEIGGAAYLSGLALGYGGATAAGSGAATIGGTAAAGSLRNLGLAAGGGLLIGSLLGKNAPQAQTMTTAANPNTYQYNIQTDRSLRSQDAYQITTNTIADSPYASLGGSPAIGQSQPTAWTQEPTQSAPTYASGSQSQEQGSSLLIPALIVAAALMLTRR
jgi:hypothetical protein